MPALYANYSALCWLTSTDTDYVQQYTTRAPPICDVQVDECLSMPCGEMPCIDEVNGYHCVPPTATPTVSPTEAPSLAPTAAPTTASPTAGPTLFPLPCGDMRCDVPARALCHKVTTISYKAIQPVLSVVAATSIVRPAGFAYTYRLGVMLRVDGFGVRLGAGANVYAMFGSVASEGCMAM